MRAPICLCVAVSHNETDEFAEAAMNAPLLARAMQPGLLQWIAHVESIRPVGTSRH